METSVFDDIEWLLKHPEFEYRPASIDEFLGPEYLDIYDKVRPGVKDVLYAIFGKEAQDRRLSLVERAIMTGAIGIGKNFRPDELVLTPNGEVPIGSLRVGQSVIGKDGKPHRVTGVFPNEGIQYYRMTFCDGTSIECGEEHLWEVDQDGTRGHKITVLSTKQILDKGLRWNSDRKWRFSLPNVEPVDFADEELVIPTYSWAVIFLYGVVLGDRIHFLFHDDKIFERMKEELSPWAVPYIKDGKFCFKKHDHGFGNRLWDELSTLPDDENARTLDRKYLFGKSADRLELLRGLMDAKIAKGQRKDAPFYFQSNREDLLNTVVHLVRSLGGYARIVTRHEYINGWNHSYPSAHVVLPQGPFWAFKFLNYDPKKQRGAAKLDQRRIVDIEKIDVGPGVCIAVDAKDHLYVARDFIVTHNTTFASIALPYMAHWVLCLKDPQAYYDLLPGSRIAFMQMSTSEQQARDVIFGDIDARIKNSPWFNKHYPRDPRYTKSIRFPKDIWIIPGDSTETTFEGYNILGGILDEADSHKVTKDKDYAQIGMDTIENRIKSRYVDHSDPTREGHKGLLIVIGQMKSQFGFASRIYNQYKQDPRAVAIRMTIWESFGWEKYMVDGKRNSFWYDVKNKKIMDTEIGEKIGATDGHVIEVPRQYLYEFQINPEKALKDLGGIPPGAADPFISQVAKIDDAHSRWMMHHGGIDAKNPLEETCIAPQILPHMISSPSIRRACHIDLAYSGNGDSAGIAIGHISEIQQNQYGDPSPYIVIDLLIRVRAKPGEQILLSDLRSYIYALMRDYHYKFHRVTLDGFQSIDTIQQFRKRKLSADYLSIDKSREPYENFRDALYEDRVEFPPYMTYLAYGSDKPIDILHRELIALQDMGSKIDHPPNGSKDVADAVAGVVSSLMSDSTYRKGVPSQRRNDADSNNSAPQTLEKLLAGFETASAYPEFKRQFNVISVPPDISGIATGGLPKRFRPE